MRVRKRRGVFAIYGSSHRYAIVNLVSKSLLFVRTEVECRNGVSKGLVMKPSKHQRSNQRCQDLFCKVHSRTQSSVLRLYIHDAMYCLTKTSLLVMYQSNRSFNIPPGQPPGI